MDSFGWRHALALAAVLLAACGAWRAAGRGRQGELHWDGQHWTWAGSQPLTMARAIVHLDFQRLLLLRLKAEAGTGWLWLDRRACPERWRDVRRALYARAVVAEPVPGAPVPASKARLPA